MNFKCKKCKVVFDCDIGNFTIDESVMSPVFDNPILCPNCGELKIDDVDLTDLGSEQLAKYAFNM